MYHFILQILIMLSLGGMIYMIARKIPQVSDTLAAEETSSRTLWNRVDTFVNSLPLEKFDFLISQFLEKNIRKMKLLLMRTDNYLSHHLEKFKKVKHRKERQKAGKKKFEALYEEMKTDKEDDLVEASIKEELLKAVAENNKS